MSTDASMRLRSQCQIFMLCAVGLAFAGCGPRDPRVTIHGTVSLDGQPLSEGQIIFRPEDSSLRAEGGAIKNGEFTIHVFKGPHRIAINAQVAEKRKVDPNAPPGTSPEVEYRNIIPARFNEKSTLSCTVESAKDRPRFELSSEK
jgi:hypothetical protein